MMKKILRAIPVVLILAFCLSVTAMAYSGSTSVTLKTTQNEATSSSLSCHFAKVSASNRSTSQYSVSAALQLSSGSGWSDYGTVTLAPGSSGNTGSWGHSDYVYLCRAKLWVPGLPSAKIGGIQQRRVRPETGRTRLHLRLKIQYLQSPECVWAGRHKLCLPALSAKKRGGRQQSMARSVHLDH